MAENTLRHVTLAIDADYVLPATVALRSVFDNLERPDTWAAHLLLYDVPADELRALTQSLDDVPLDLVEVDTAAVDKLPPRYRHITRAAYLRLLAPELLADVADRVLYLDADVLVLGDLKPLLDTKLDGQPVAAALEHYAPVVSHPDAIEGWEQLGFDPKTPFCNSGVLVIDVPAWQQCQIGEQALAFCERYRPRTMDQAALNAALRGRWKPLDRRWNFSSYWDGEVESHPEVLADVRILHFLGGAKPWLPGCEEWKVALYETYRDRTTFRRR